MANLNSAAFFYGDHPPQDQLRAFDAVVVNPNAKIDPLAFDTPDSMLFAYVSLGEADEDAFYRKSMSSNWLVGKNEIWKSQVIDQANAGWQRFFMDDVITPLWQKGYRGFFLDTLDSYTLIAHDDKARKAQVAGLISNIRAIKQKYPDAKIILNRGFELLPTIHNDIVAVAVESLFAGWNQATKKYEIVSSADREYLLPKLADVQKMNIPVIVIDYVSPEDARKALDVANKIKSLNMIPWVSNPELNKMGVGAVNPLPRKIFILYTEQSDDTTFTPASFLLLALPLQYLGYLPEYHNINSETLPSFISKRDYAGIVIWGQPTTVQAKQSVYKWFIKHINQSLPIAIIESFPFELTRESAIPLGLDLPVYIGEKPKSVHLLKRDSSMVGYEIKPYANRFLFQAIRAKNSRVYLQYIDNKNRIEDAVVITPWGGYALDPFVVTQMPNESIFWVINPFVFLTEALRLKNILVPEVTTENGRRLMMVHIDGDGFPSKAEWRGSSIAAVELKNKILDRYKIPTGVSVITGDISPDGLFPEYSERHVKIAREIFALPWVESASHTYSHPFNWIDIQTYKKSGKYNLPIEGYIYDPHVEIQGSVDYINQYLAPKGRPCKVLYWSGDANPDGKTVGLAYKAKIANINGGDTFRTYANNSLSAVGPYGIMLDGYYQIYAPISNENIYTNEWKGPFYGFEKVIETFKLTDHPYRLKPIDIYYHFYSLSKIASLKGLIKTYEWALAQAINPIFPSEYIAKVLDFNATSISIKGDAWIIRNAGNLRELRAPVSFGYPDLEKSKNLIGYNKYNDSYYLHLGLAHESSIYFSKTPSKLPYLIDSNGRVVSYRREGKKLIIRLKSHVPLIVTLGNLKGCIARYTNIKRIDKKGNVGVFNFIKTDSNELLIEC